MPAEFQKAMDCTLIRLKNTYCFLDDFLIVSKRSEEDHEQIVCYFLERHDEEYRRFNLPKCHLAKLETDWLGCQISQSRILPIENKTSAIVSLEAPKKLKKLSSFLGSENYISKFIPNPAQISHPLRLLLRKSAKFIETDNHENCFLEAKNRITKATENCNYNAQLETRVELIATGVGIQAAHEQLKVDGRKPIAFTSRFQNSC